VLSKGPYRHIVDVFTAAGDLQVQDSQVERLGGRRCAFRLSDLAERDASSVAHRLRHYNK
jgi:hypothetical protein